jgi:sarcosine oxidase
VDNAQVAISQTFDVIVAGLGAMGSAAAYHLARRGQRVLGLDAHAVGHTLGSSHGETRIIRQAYFEQPAYVPLVQRAYELWEQLERDSQTRLLYLTGGLFVGPPDGALVAGSRASAEQHGLPHELLDAAGVRRRFPAFHAQPTDSALFEERAGILLPEACIDAHLKLAAAAGAQLHHDEPVLEWSAGDHGLRVNTAIGTYAADRLVVTVGAWAGQLLSDINLPIQAERIPLYWFKPTVNAPQFDMGAMPVWIWQVPGDGDYFGTPHLAWPGVKVGKHHSHVFVDPDAVDRAVHPTDEQPLRTFLGNHLPDLNGAVTDARVCLYENSPDTDFLIDIHPKFPNVVYGAGFSGHGFKFATAVGEILADLAIDGKTTPAADFLKFARLTGLSDPKSEASASR